MCKKVFVTGAAGFIGLALVDFLCEKKYHVLSGVRIKTDKLHPLSTQIEVGDQVGKVSWEKELNGVDVVVHLAGKAHVSNRAAKGLKSDFLAANVDVTLRLANQAAAAGVSRFIFISSIGVCGNQTFGSPFCTDHQPKKPITDYAVSKYEAEKGLRELSSKTSMDIVIIRPPLVYGNNAPGNFGRLIKITSKCIPLPLGGINNKRSLVFLSNLIDFIALCISHPKAGNQTFHVSDGVDVSTSELMLMTSRSACKPCLLFPFPHKLVVRGLNMFGKSLMAQQLYGDLQVDISKNKRLLGWEPPVSISQAFKQINEG